MKFKPSPSLPLPPSRLLMGLQLLAAFLAGLAAAQGAPPNVILIMTDDQGYGDFGFTGNPLIETPNLDAMASRSAQMKQFYVSPVCAPTRASLMTGRYNFRTRAIDTWNGHARMDPDETTLAEILSDAGYATGLFGKWHLGDSYPMRPQDQGFDEVLMHRGGGIGQPSDPDGAENAYTDPILFHNGERVQMKGYCTDIYFDEAMKWIGEQKQNNRPFFLYLPTNAPHGPFGDVPVALYEKYRKMNLSNTQFSQEKGHPLPSQEDLDKRARIYAMITNVDENVGRLFQHLDRLDLTGNTLVIFLVDNGPDGARYVSGFKGMKGEVYEGGIRSPLLLRWPAGLRPGASSDRISAHIDLAPTILEACGVEDPRTALMDGRSILPLLQGKQVAWPDRYIVIQAHRGEAPELFHHFAIRNQRWKLLNNSGFGNWNYPGQDNFELFDMEADPYAQKDLAGENPEVLERMKLAYMEWFLEVSSTRPDNYLAPRIGLGSAYENPVSLTRQDGERISGSAFGRDTISVWKTEVLAPGDYFLRFRFAALVKSAEVHLRLPCGKTITQAVPAGATEITLEPVRLPEGHWDLSPLLKTDGRIFTPWKVDVGIRGE